MRKVIYRKVIVINDSNVLSSAILSNFIYEGFFHEWGLNSEVYQEGIATKTVGIVEESDGSIVVLDPDDIKFVQ